MHSPWRVVPLDGAALAFDPATGRRIRFRQPELTQQAPLTVLFGITGVCNKSCGFCHREMRGTSQWTIDTAATFLGTLADRGVLEVAFGGGEPLLFPGFEALLDRLQATPLAVHLTTNGSLLSQERLRGWRNKVREVRLSLYPGFERPLQLLQASGQRFGANLLITPENIEHLPELATRLEGASDLLLLTYVGTDPTLHLSDDQRAHLAQLIPTLPLRCGLSVCAGRVGGLPVLGASGRSGCGAGREFMTVTADKKLLPCSFHRGGLRFASAKEALELWERLSWGSAGVQGCRFGESEETSEDIQSWTAYSGNNSSSYVMIGEFDSPERAATLARELIEVTASRSRGSGIEERIARFIRKKYGLDLNPSTIYTTSPPEVWQEAAPSEESERWRRPTPQATPLFRRYGVAVDDVPDRRSFAAIGHNILIYDSPTLSRFSGFEQVAPAAGGWATYLPLDGWLGGDDRHSSVVIGMQFPSVAACEEAHRNFQTHATTRIGGDFRLWMRQNRLFLSNHIWVLDTLARLIQPYRDAGIPAEATFTQFPVDPDLPDFPTHPGVTLLAFHPQADLADAIAARPEMWDWVGGGPIKGSRRWPSNLRSEIGTEYATFVADAMSPLFVRGMAKRAEAVSVVEGLPVWVGIRFLSGDTDATGRLMGQLQRRLGSGLVECLPAEEGLRVLVEDPSRAVRVAEEGARSLREPVRVVLIDAHPVRKIEQLLSRYPQSG